MYNSVPFSFIPSSIYPHEYYSNGIKELQLSYNGIFLVPYETHYYELSLVADFWNGICFYAQNYWISQS